MTTSSRLQFLHSALDRAETRLKLCTGAADWRGAREAAEDAAAVEAEISELRRAAAAQDDPARRVRVDG